MPEVAEPPVHGRTSVSSSQSAGVLFMGGAFLFQRIQYNTKNRSLTSKLEDPHIQNEEGPFFDSFKYNIPSQ